MEAGHTRTGPTGVRRSLHTSAVDNVLLDAGPENINPVLLVVWGLLVDRVWNRWRTKVPFGGLAGMKGNLRHQRKRQS